MGFFDVAQELIDQTAAAADKGVAVARDAVSGMAIEQQGFAKEFVRTCLDAYAKGWHEANGGNLSYVLKPEEVTAARPYFYDTPSNWVALPKESKDLAGSFLMVTGSGKHFRNMGEDLRSNVGILEIDEWGMAWRTVWGFKECKPTSELSLHLGCLISCREAGKAASVVYHGHPAQLMALSSLLPVDGKALTRALWKGLAEGIVACPKGVAFLGWYVPGTNELAVACADSMRESDAVVAANHGVFCCGETFDQVFGLVHTLDKAAGIHLTARAANGGSDQFVNVIPDQGLRDIAERYGLSARLDYLEQ